MAKGTSRSNKRPSGTKTAPKASRKTVAKPTPKATKRPAAKGIVDPLPGRDPFEL